MKKIDILDFDKTLYMKDCSKEFFWFCLKVKKTIIKYIPRIIIYFITYYLGFISKEKLKEYYFKFLKDFDNIDEIIKLFWKDNKNYIRFDIIKKCKNEIVVISASPLFLIEDICLEVGVKKVIGSNVDKRNGKYNSLNCKGEEKINRLNEIYDNYKIINFYSDSYSDMPLALIASKAYLIKDNEIVKWNFSHQKKRDIKEIVRYLFIGFLTMFITLMLYYLLTFTFLSPNDKFELQIANFISWLGAVIFSYICNRKYVFNSNNKSVISEFAGFLFSRVFTLIVDMLLMYLMVFSLRIDDKISKLVVQVIVVILNYIVSKFFVFKKGK